MDIARRFFRVVEQEDGAWVCRVGRLDIDRHRTRDDAVEHIVRTAAEHRPSRVYVHPLDRTVVAVLTLD